MPIRPLLEADPGRFGPEDTAAIVAAFEDILRHLRLVERDDPVVTMLAELTLEVARQGERDPARLRDEVLKLMSR
jgi:hypothetical protein